MIGSEPSAIVPKGQVSSTPVPVGAVDAARAGMVKEDDVAIVS